MKLNVENGFNTKNLKVLRGQLNKVLREAGFEDLEFDTGCIKYENAKCTVPLEIKIKGKKSHADKKFESEIAANLLTTEIRDGKQLVEYKPRNFKYPFIYVEVATGKRFKCSSTSAKAYFKK